MERRRLRHAVEEALRRRPVVALLGARQTGRTTLARALARLAEELRSGW